jgi:hypothetical protein
VLRYFPNKGGKLKNSYNVKQDETMEDMDKSVPRIYASLDNKKYDF